uniref:Uncharacterized protein n=1 Tax=Tanacetum cinerariifolium TaxID=118510 RepID=A0A699GPJ3_TANCI|nr:hypothetical protein [Tanacetum cinerariifolium]
MNLTTLPLSFWDYAPESATRILNIVPIKKALVKRDTPDKLQQRFVKCIFIGYPKEIMGYYFYFPPENKIVVARYAEFFEKNLLTQEVSGRARDLEEIQDEDTSPSEITSEIPMEVEGFEPPQDEGIPIRRSERTGRAPDRLCLNIEIDAMNAEIQSMMDNMVWVLVDLPLGCKTVGSNWIFKKKTNMDETFSPVPDIRAIRILISIASYYDYEIWKMDIKIAFLNGYLDKDIYMVKPKGEATFILGIKNYRDRSKRLIGLGQNAYIDKILKRYRMDNSKRGHIPMQENLNLNKTQGASTPKEVKRMQNDLMLRLWVPLCMQ